MFNPKRFMIEVSVSKLHRWMCFISYSVIHLGIAILLSDLSFNLSVIAAALCPSFLLFLLFALKNNQQGYCLSIDEGGKLIYIAGVRFSGELMTKSYVSRWLNIVWFERELDSQPIRLMIWRDSVNDDDFRHLSRIIRLKRHMI